MDLIITGNKPTVSLLKIPYVTDIYSALIGKRIVLYLECKEGDEQHLFDSIPKCIHDEMKVTKSLKTVFLQSKK